MGTHNIKHVHAYFSADLMEWNDVSQLYSSVVLSPSLKHMKCSHCAIHIILIMLSTGQQCEFNLPDKLPFEDQFDP